MELYHSSYENQVECFGETQRKQVTKKTRKQNAIYYIIKYKHTTKNN